MITFDDDFDDDLGEIEADDIPDLDIPAGVHGGHCCRPVAVKIFDHVYPPHHAQGSPCQTGGPCCDHKWTGEKTGHCGGPAVGGCHQTFFGDQAWDSHFKAAPAKRGDLAAHRTPEEMLAGGMWQVINAQGTPVWHGKWNKEGKQLRRTVEVDHE